MRDKAYKALIISAVVLSIPLSLSAEEITVTVKGMVCSFCAQGIKKTFGKNDQVASIEVDLDRKIVKINTKKDSKLEDKVIEQIINDAGYDVMNIDRK